MDSYKKVMDQIKVDDEFKGELMKRLEVEKRRQSRRVKKPSRYYPAAASVAAAAVLLFTLYFSKSFILPLTRHNTYDGASAQQNQQVVLSPKKDSPTSAHDSVTVNDSSEPVLDSNPLPPASGSSRPTSPALQDIPATDATPYVVPAPHEPSGAPTDELLEPVPVDGYIISYPNYNKGASSASADDVNYDCVIHFNFTGFENYGVDLHHNDMIFIATHAKNYSLADFLRDYYYAIVPDDTMTDIENGVVESFFGVSVQGKLQINVYVDGYEIMNLETTPLSRICDMTDVYLTVSVV